ncbi:hypothetical protein [Saccharopolyspora sp. CA-218241]|uniref:hypothetical protein n=1 Tax=Saccharopolyspora sp. CA-218241 TaxID=3240027 RepID=UPI003D96C7E7
MSVHINLSTARVTAIGVRIPQTTQTVRDVAYTLSIPAQPVTHSVMVRPLIEPDEDTNSIRVRLDRWMAFNDELCIHLPLYLVDMATAVRAALDFEGDPGIGWRSGHDELERWAMTWLKQDESRVGGGW